MDNRSKELGASVDDVERMRRYNAMLTNLVSMKQVVTKVKGTETEKFAKFMSEIINEALPDLDDWLLDAMEETGNGYVQRLVQSRQKTS